MMVGTENEAPAPDMNPLAVAETQRGLFRMMFPEGTTVLVDSVTLTMMTGDDDGV